MGVWSGDKTAPETGEVRPSGRGMGHPVVGTRKTVEESG